MKVSRKGKSNRIKIDYTLVDVYDYYKSLSEKPLSYNDFRNFLLGEDGKSGLIKYIKEDILFAGFPLFLAARTGDLCILKNEPKIKFVEGKLKGLPVDWPNTLKLWKEDPKEAEKKTLLYHFNKHSNGFIFKVRWDISTANFKAKHVYKFRAVREINRSLKTILFTKNSSFRTIK